MKIAALSDRELLALLVGEKTATKLYRGQLMPLAFGGQDNNPHPKLAASLELARRLLHEKIQLGPALSSPKEVGEYLTVHFVGRQHEAFVVIFLDNRHRVIAIDEMFRGTLTGASVYPREVVRAALRCNAGACIFAHNHPSGVAEPSRADETITNTLKQALSLVDVRVLDHFVVSGETVVSFTERGLL